MRINMGYGSAGDGGFVYSVKGNEFFSYEQDSDILHEKYGGSRYYTSQSGLSGAGFLAKADDLIQFGFYRTDSGRGQMEKVVHSVGGRPIYGYVPIKSHVGIDESMPFVLSDGHKVAFCYKHEVAETLLWWKGLEGKLCEEAYYDFVGRANRFRFTLYMSKYHKYRGVRATRFVNLLAKQQEVEKVEAKATTVRTLFERKLNITEVPLYHRAPNPDSWTAEVEEPPSAWLHISKDKYFDMKWTSDPREIVGEVAEGWSGLGGGLLCKRKGLLIEAFIEAEREKVGNGKYIVDGVTDKWIDYEENFSVLEWFSKPPEAWGEYFLAKLTTKARKDYVYACSDDAAKIKRMMEQNPEARISLQDSVESGNCEIGSKRFVEQYAIKVDENNSCSMQELLGNDNIDEMLRTFAFRKAVFSAINKEV